MKRERSSEWWSEQCKQEQKIKCIFWRLLSKARINVPGPPQNPADFIWMQPKCTLGHVRRAPLCSARMCVALTQTHRPSAHQTSASGREQKTRNILNTANCSENTGEGQTFLVGHKRRLREIILVQLSALVFRKILHRLLQQPHNFPGWAESVSTHKLSWHSEEFWHWQHWEVCVCVCVCETRGAESRF